MTAFQYDETHIFSIFALSHIKKMKKNFLAVDNSAYHKQITSQRTECDVIICCPVP